MSPDVTKTVYSLEKLLQRQAKYNEAKITAEAELKPLKLEYENKKAEVEEVFGTSDVAELEELKAGLLAEANDLIKTIQESEEALSQ